jgi:hypothetical protein
LTPRTVFAQDATAKAQTSMIAKDPKRDSFMDDVSLNS